MREYSRHIDMVEALATLAVTAVALQFEQPLDKGIGRRLPQRISHRHVDVIRYLRRQRMQQRHQQRLVGKHYGRLLVEGQRRRDLPQHGCGILALKDIRHG